MNPKMMLVAQVARELKMDGNIIRYHIKLGRIPYQKLGTYKLVNIDDVVDCLKVYGDFKIRQHLEEVLAIA